MAITYLKPIYKKLYDEDFVYASFPCRMKMQKAIYLLQNAGIPVGDYGFRWYKHGPYSQRLQDDMFFEDGKTIPQVTFSDNYLPRLDKIKSIIHSPKKGDSYSLEAWVECLASLVYLKKNILGYQATKEDTLIELQKRKPHLKDQNTNDAAYDIIGGTSF